MARGWVERGTIRAANPNLATADRRRLKHPVFLFEQDQLLDVGEMIGRALIDRLDLAVLALAIQRQHVHLVIGSTPHDIGHVAKCAKEAVRYGLRPGRPIWTGGYDKRFCFDDASVMARVRYVERHNEHMDWPPRPWGFITGIDDYLRPSDGALHHN